MQKPKVWPKKQKMYEEIQLVLLGALIGWVVSWFRFRVSENANLISDHIKDMEIFAQSLREHWTTSYVDCDESEHRKDIAKIKALHHSISSFYGESKSRLGGNRLREYQALQVKLFKLGMGGSFESLCRDFDENTAIETQQVAWEIIQNLRAARREQYGLLSHFN